MKTWKRNSNGANSCYRQPEDKINDQKLIKRLKKKDPEAFEEFVELYKPILEQLCIFQCHGEFRHVEDMMQITLMHIYQKLHQFRGEAKFTSWLFRVSLNKIREFQRKQCMRTDSLVLLNKDSEIKDLKEKEQQSPANLDDWLDAKRFVIKIANSNMLKTHLDAVKASVHFDSTTQCAAALGIPLPTYKSRLYRGLKKLKKEYREYNKRSTMGLYFEAVDEGRLAGNQ